MLVRAVVVFVAIVLAGCGGGDGASKEEFAAEAAAICADLNGKVNKLENFGEAIFFDAEEGDREAIKTLTASYGKLVAVEEAAMDELRTLPRPAEADQLISAFERLFALARDDLERLRGRRLKGFRSFGERHGRGQDVLLAASALGFSCYPPHAPPH